MDILYITIIFILVILCIIFGIKRHKDTSAQEKYIEALAQKAQDLQEENNAANDKLMNTIVNFKSIESKIEELDKLYDEKQNHIQDLEKSAEKIYEEKTKALEIEFKQKEEQENIAYLQLIDVYMSNIEEIKQELLTIKSTRDAAIEAWRKEEEIKANQDFYKLLLSPQDKQDIALLENIKPKFSNPRVISKLIWQSYLQPITKVKFPMIIGDKTCGVYKITNVKNNMCYIGQAKSLYKRWTDHVKAACGLDTPSGNKLYKAMMEDGIDSFTFEVIDFCEEDELNQKEAYFIDLYSAVDYGYNSQSGIK